MSTLHTNDAARAISRLINLGVSPFQLASSLLGIVGQRLVRTICPECKQPYKPTGDELEFLFTRKDDKSIDKETTLYRGTGCGACRNTGYRGRQAVYEILEADRTIRNMVVERTSDDQIKSAAITQGMKTLKKQGISLALQGTTTLEELIRVIDMREE